MKEHQRSRRMQHTQGQEMQSYRSRSQGAHSYATITHGKSEMDFPMDRDPNRDRSSSCNMKGASSESGLPAYDSVVVKDRYPNTSGQVPLEGVSVKGAGAGAVSMSMSTSLQPNRRKESGDVELGGVLSASEVELVRARSQRDRTVSEYVYYWRSPLGACCVSLGVCLLISLAIDIGRPAASQWQR